MQTYDIVMLVVLLGTTVFGVWKGMAWQAASLLSLVASYFVALRASAVVAPYFGDPPTNRFVAMLVLYLATSAGIWLAFRFVSGMIDRVRLKEFDRQVGGLFGAAKGILLCVVITFFAVTMSSTARDMVLRSRSGYYISLLIDRAEPVMPAEVRETLRPYLDELDKQLAPTHSSRLADEETTLFR
jgi:membrane protein required for colicin V production